MRSFLAAIAFYTVLPLPRSRTLDFDRVARWLPVVGLAIGGLLAVTDALLGWVAVPAVRSLLVLCLWVGVTGGLHLDGVVDAADGLAAGDRSLEGTDKRLQVMADSYAGAFGVMAAVLLLLLKFVALLHLPEFRWTVLLLAPVWGRWGQLVAIAAYPYLKPTGKGRFLKDTTSTADLVAPTILLLAVSLSVRLLVPEISGTLWILSGPIAALVTGAWFDRQLGGHTGDTYGATVEWTEAIVLVAATFCASPGLN